MKSELLLAGVGLLLAALPLSSIAACSSPQSVRVSTRAALTALLQGNTACVPPVTQPTMESQELHQSGGALVDYKRGPGDPTDPTKRVGSWAVTGVDGRGVFVTYDYGGGQTYTYSVWNNGDGTHSFCSAKPEIKVRIKSGDGAC